MVFTGDPDQHAKKPYSFVIFQEARTPAPTPLDPLMHFEGSNCALLRLPLLTLFILKDYPLRGAFGKFLAWSFISVTDLQTLSCLVPF